MIDRDILEKKITNVENAKLFIDELYRNGLIFHWDDDPSDIECFSSYEAKKLSRRVDEMLALEDIENWGDKEDAYGYALYLIHNNSVKYN